jgi:excisionase family DNA binding protein
MNPAAACGHTGPRFPDLPLPPLDVLTPAQVAQTLGVTEADVIASIETGDLKGKKIGTQYRITKAALDRVPGAVSRRRK